jgi:hypothetical protein
MSLQLGDKIHVRAALGTRHYGIYVGSMGGYLNGVVHNDKYRRRVVLVALEDFLAGREGVVESRVYGGWRAQVAVARRALDLCGREYDLINFNCEHAATLAQTGTARSSQVRTAVLFGLVVLSLYALKDSAAA